jgi:hypothetical protein
MQEKIRQAKHIIKNCSCYGLECIDCLVCPDGCDNISMHKVVQIAEDYLSSIISSENRFVGMSAEEAYQVGISEASKNQMNPNVSEEKTIAWNEVYDLCNSLGMTIKDRKSGLQNVLDFIKDLSDKSKTCKISEGDKSSVEYDIIYESYISDVVKKVNKKISDRWEVYGDLFMSRSYICQTMIKRN